MHVHMVHTYVRRCWAMTMHQPPSYLDSTAPPAIEQLWWQWQRRSKSKSNSSGGSNFLAFSPVASPAAGSESDETAHSRRPIDEIMDIDGDDGCMEEAAGCRTREQADSPADHAIAPVVLGSCSPSQALLRSAWVVVIRVLLSHGSNTGLTATA